MFTFASPLYFLLFLPLLAATGWVYRRRARAGLLFSGAHRCVVSSTTWRTRLTAWLPALTLLGLGMSIVALAQPRTVLSEVHRTVDVIAIQMVVDVSGSMEALDLSDISGDRIVRQRSRLDVVKETFAAFIKERPDDLIGLVTFGGFASTRCPLTVDHNALLHVLDGVRIPKPAQDAQGIAGNQEELMTAIGDGLATGCARLKSVEPKSRIVVLLSDGESNTGVIQPEEALQVAHKMGIKVYTICIGTTGQAPFLAKDLFGREGIQWANVTVDETLLRKIAKETGGQYFNVRDPDGLKNALKDIGSLETTRIERETYEQYDEWFHFALIPGLLLIAAGTGLNMAVARRLL